MPLDQRNQKFGPPLFDYRHAVVLYERGRPAHDSLAARIVAAKLLVEWGQKRGLRPADGVLLINREDFEARTGYGMTFVDVERWYVREAVGNPRLEGGGLIGQGRIGNEMLVGMEEYIELDDPTQLGVVEAWIAATRQSEEG